MKKQKICVIGGGITGLTVASALAKQNVSIDLIDKNFYNNYKTSRTTAVSNSNYLFLKKINFSDVLSWPCREMELYDINEKFKKKRILNFNFDTNNNNILHIIDNKNFIIQAKKKIKKNKKISIKSNFKVLKIFSLNGLKCIKTSNKKIFKYSLIILCTGKNSFLAKNILDGKYFNYDYKEKSIVLKIQHNSCKNNIARQFFLKEGPVAFLPISNNRTSIIWSVKKSFLINNENNKENFIKGVIENLSKGIYKNLKFFTKTEYYNLNFHRGNKCYDDRVIVFGDALYSVHPIAGQGFNMILRDLQKLIKTINKKVSLGLDVGSSTILSELNEDIMSNNFIYSMGIDAVKKLFSSNNTIIKSLRNYSALEINKRKNIKNFFVNIADEGINL